MLAVEPETDSASKLRLRNLGWLTILWATVVGAVMSWQAYSYTGFFAWIAEIQFRHIDRMFPVLTVLLAVIVLSLPLLLLMALRARRRRRLYGKPQAFVVLSRERHIGKALAVVSGSAFVGALILLLAGLTIGSYAQKRSTDLPFSQGARPIDGYITTSAVALTNRIGFYRESMGVVGRDLYVVPIVAKADSKRIKYFLETRPQKPRSSERSEVTGFLKAQSVPGGLERLYENAGYTIDRPTYVIFANYRSSQWPMFSAAGSLAVFGFLLLLAFLVHRVFFRRLLRESKEDVNPAT